MPAGETIRLRPIDVGDAKLLAGWFGDPDFLGPFFNVFPQSAGQWEKNLASEPPFPDWNQYLIVKNDTEDPVVDQFGARRRSQRTSERQPAS